MQNETNQILTPTNVIGILAIWAVGTNWYANALKNRKTRDDLYNWITADRFRERYGKVLSKGLNFFDRFFGGEKLIGFKAISSAYSRCFILSLIYGLLFFLIGWTFVKAPGKWGGIQMLPDDTPSVFRWLIFLLILTLGSIYGIFL